MKNSLVKLAFILPGLCILGWGIFYHLSVQSWASVTLPISGYDPRNLLSGHYIQYEIQWHKVDCVKLFNGPSGLGSCPIDDFEGRNRFYIPERHAATLEELLGQNASGKQFAVTYAYHPGEKAIAKELLINGNAWARYLEHNLQHRNRGGRDYFK